jgi:membrane complex biogenesis BtpA family protein
MNGEPRLPFARKAVIGMVHVRALPGTPYHDQPLAEILGTAAAEARMWTEAGCDGVLVENMHDRPYLCRTVGSEVVAAMTTAVETVIGAAGVPVGVQILAGANREALAVAHICGAAFIRAEGFVYAHVADEGLMASADAGPLLRYRRDIGAERVAILADVHKKHASHAITADVPLAEAVRAAEFFGADAVVITGTTTGRHADPEDVRCAAEASALPVAVGSGLSAENIAAYWPLADLFIVGSSIKRDGLWSNPIDTLRLKAFMAAVEKLR